MVDTRLTQSNPALRPPAMRQWFRVEEPNAAPALVARRSVRSIDPQEALFVDEEGNGYRLAAVRERGQAPLRRGHSGRGWAAIRGGCRADADQNNAVEADRR